MVRGSRVSRRALMAAWQLGRKMALTDRGVRANLRDVAHYTSYRQFRMAHRAFHESSRRFVPWDKKLQRMAESEAWWMGYDLDRSVRAWDGFHMFVLAPMKEAFWRGWETHARLEPSFLERRKAWLDRVRETPNSVVRTSDLAPAIPDLTSEQVTETERWDRLASKLFGAEQETTSQCPEPPEPDDEFWELPPPPPQVGALADSGNDGMSETLPELPGVLQMRMRRSNGRRR